MGFQVDFFYPAFSLYFFNKDIVLYCRKFDCCFKNLRLGSGLEISYGQDLVVAVRVKSDALNQNNSAFEHIYIYIILQVTNGMISFFAEGAEGSISRRRFCYL